MTSLDSREVAATTASRFEPKHRVAPFEGKHRVAPFEPKHRRPSPTDALLARPRWFLVFVGLVVASLPVSVWLGSSNQSRHVAPVAAPASSASVQGAAVAVGDRLGSNYTVPLDARTVSVSWYAAGGSTDQTFVPVVFALTNGKPGAAIATGARETVKAHAAPAWIKSSLPNASIPAGTYLVALVAVSNGDARLFYRPSIGTSVRWHVDNVSQPTAVAATQPDSRLWDFQFAYSLDPAWSPLASPAQSPSVFAASSIGPIGSSGPAVEALAAPDLSSTVGPDSRDLTRAPITPSPYPLLPGPTRSSPALPAATTQAAATTVPSVTPAPATHSASATSAQSPTAAATTASQSASATASHSASTAPTTQAAPPAPAGTGAGAGLVSTALTVHSGDLVISTPGTTVSDMHVTGSLYIAGAQGGPGVSNVTVNNVQVDGGIYVNTNPSGNIYSPVPTNITIEHVDAAGLFTAGFANLTLDAINVHDSQNSPNAQIYDGLNSSTGQHYPASNLVLENSWFHGFKTSTTSAHLENVHLGGVQGAVIRNNLFQAFVDAATWNETSLTASFTMDAYSGSGTGVFNSNITFENNTLQGDAYYLLYFIATGNSSVLNNAFSTAGRHNYGGFAGVQWFQYTSANTPSGGYPKFTQSGNTLNGAPVSLPGGN